MHFKRTRVHTNKLSGKLPDLTRQTAWQTVRYKTRHDNTRLTHILLLSTMMSTGRTRVCATYLRMIITRIVMIAPRNMKPPNMATAMMPSRLYLVLARLLCARMGGLKLARTLWAALWPAPAWPWWPCEWPVGGAVTSVLGALPVVVDEAGDEASTELTDCWLAECTLTELVVARGVESYPLPIWPTPCGFEPNAGKRVFAALDWGCCCLALLL